MEFPQMETSNCVQTIASKRLTAEADTDSLTVRITRQKSIDHTLIRVPKWITKRKVDNEISSIRTRANCKHIPNFYHAATVSLRRLKHRASLPFEIVSKEAPRCLEARQMDKLARNQSLHAQNEYTIATKALQNAMEMHLSTCKRQNGNEEKDSKERLEMERDDCTESLFDDVNVPLAPPSFTAQHSLTGGGIESQPTISQVDTQHFDWTRGTLPSIEMARRMQPENGLMRISSDFRKC